MLRSIFAIFMSGLMICTTAAQTNAVLIDAGDNAGLIKAIEDANSGEGPQSIFITPGPNGETTFTFTMPYMGTDSALPPVTRPISIYPARPKGSRITIERDPNAESFRLADVQSGGLALSHFSIENFNIDGNGGVIRASGMSFVSLISIRATNNFAGGSGGVVSMEGDSKLEVRGTPFLPGELLQNRAGNTGGAISVTGNASGNISGQIFVGNTAGIFGCDLNLNSSSTANWGRALYIESNTFTGDCANVLVEDPFGRMLFRNNTFAGMGDAIDTTDTAILFGNLFGISPATSARTNAKQAAPKPPSTQAICNDFGTGAISSQGFNLETSNSCFLDQPSDLVDTDPQIMNTGNNVYALMPGSPAIDAGSSVIANAISEKNGLPCGYLDARGLGRPQDANLDGTYECDIGHYEVQGGPDIGNAQSSAYFDPSRNGEGIFMEMIGNDLALVAQFSYAVDGSGPAWFIGIGSRVGNSVVIDDVLQPVGGVFGEAFDPDAIEEQPVGSLSLVFSNCESGQEMPGKMLFESSDATPFGDLLVDAVRISNIIDCQANTTPQAGRSGSFYDPARNGEGVFVQWLTNGQVVIIFYTFDTEGNQLWIISDTTVVDGDTVTAQMLYPAASTQFGANFDPNEIDLQPWGTLTLEYEPGCGALEINYSSTVGTFGAGSYDYVRLSSLAGTSCDL